MAMRYIVPALAVAGRAAAQCSAAATTTLQSNADASALASCRTFSGSIAIATGTTDDITLDGIQTITGSLVANAVPNMASLEANDLTTIGQDFNLNNVQTLTTLNFPMLTTVNTIVWVGLPNLQGLSFTTGVQEASSVSIQNTQLSSLDGIDLQVVETLILANNPYLDSINMQLGNVSTALTLEANGRDLQVAFPNLQWAYNMTFRNASSISIPSLASLNGSLGFYSCYMQGISAPNLTTIGSSLAFVSNPDLTNISMPELKSVGGGLQVANNTDLMSVAGFGSLATVGGAVDFYGNFTEVELPSISNVKGAFNLQSSGNINASCAHFEPLAGQNNVIKGTYSCISATSHPGGVGSSSQSGSSTSSSAASPMLIPGMTGVLGVAAALFGLL